MQEMVDVVGVDIPTLEKNQNNSGGGQYIIKNTTSKMWYKIYSDSNALYDQMHDYQRRFPITPGEIQFWTAEMWSLLWNLWLHNIETKITKEFDFSWATDTIDTYNSKPILHMAGVTSDLGGEKFYKGDQEYGEIWYVEIVGLEIDVIGYPCDFKFYSSENFSKEPIKTDFRSNLLKSKLDENYFIKKVVKKKNKEEWYISNDKIKNIDIKKEYIIKINGYPDTFSFKVYKKFKPFDNDNLEADDDGRTDILLLKMLYTKYFLIAMPVCACVFILTFRVSFSLRERETNIKNTQI